MSSPNADYDAVWKQTIERYWPDFTEFFLRKRGFAERMFVCQYRLVDHFRLPVRSIAIPGDPSPTWRPARFELLAGASRTLFEFETFKLRDFDDRLEQLLQSHNVFAWLVATHLFTLRTRREPAARLNVKNNLLARLRLSLGAGKVP